jgi:hypothetical protein
LPLIVVLVETSVEAGGEAVVSEGGTGTNDGALLELFG